MIDAVTVIANTDRLEAVHTIHVEVDLDSI
jgi:hypothetical protein